MALSPKRIDGLWVAATAASIGCVTLIGACSTPDTSPPRSWLLYALGVAIGECPPDIAFDHAAPFGARTLLGVVVSPMQVISYTVSSKDPECDGVTASATVPDHANGQSTCTAIPL